MTAPLQSLTALTRNGLYRTLFNISKGTTFVSAKNIHNLKDLRPLPNYDHIVLPPNPILPLLPKAPILVGIKQPKLPKMNHLILGWEEHNNELIHKQYGIVLQAGAALEWGTIEAVRQSINRHLDKRLMFAVWRIEPPWLPRYKKGIGKTLGGGKGNINRHVTPVKAGRILLEVGGKVSYEEVYPMLFKVTHLLPVPALPISYELMQLNKEMRQLIESKNVNRNTYKYLMQNNFLGCHRWANERERKWFGTCP